MYYDFSLFVPLAWEIQNCLPSSTANKRRGMEQQQLSDLNDKRRTGNKFLDMLGDGSARVIK